MIHKYYLNDNYIVLDVESGSVHIVDELTYNILDNYQDLSNQDLIDKYSKKYDTNLVKSSIGELDKLVEQGLLYSQKDKDMDFSYNPVNIVKAMCLHVAHDCNLKCRYCFASQGSFQGENLLMNFETGKKAIDFILENSGNRRNLEVDFFGGEPTMNMDLVKDLVEYATEAQKPYSKNFRFTITTNGLLLDDENIDFINEHMSNVVLSLDGRKEVNDYMRPTANDKGSFDLVVPKFKKLVEKRKDKEYYIRGTFTKENLDFSKDVGLYYDLGFNKVSLEPVVTDPNEPYAIDEDDLETILNEYEKLSAQYIKMRKENPDFDFFHFMIDLDQGPCIVKRTVGCGAGSEYIAVTPTGEIYPCHQFVGQEEFKLGDLDQGIANTDLRDKFKEAGVLNKDKCKDCFAKYYCSGGCHANAYFSNEDILVPHDISCQMERKRVECAISVVASEL